MVMISFSRKPMDFRGALFWRQTQFCHRRVDALKNGGAPKAWMVQKTGTLKQQIMIMAFSCTTLKAISFYGTLLPPRSFPLMSQSGQGRKKWPSRAWDPLPGANIDCQTFAGKSALHFAAEHKLPELVEAWTFAKPVKFSSSLKFDTRFRLTWNEMTCPFSWASE